MKFSLLLAVCGSLLPMIPARAVDIERGPYLQMPAPTATTVRWRTDTANTGRVWFGVSPGSLTSIVNETASGIDHEIRPTGLQPDTRYYYAVGTSAGMLAGGDAATTFRTPPPAGRARYTRVWIAGCAGKGNTAQRDTRDAFYAFTGARGAALLLLLGDNAYESGTDAEFQTKVFDVYAPLLRMTPVLPALGNHDTDGSTTHDPQYPYYAMFTLPDAAQSGGVASGTEQYYSFDYGCTHFVCLDSQTSDRSPGGPMAQWLANDLAATTARWRIAYWHFPPYSKGGSNSDSGEFREMRETFVPILEAHGVDLVFAAHSHNYERSWLLAGHTGTSATWNDSMKVSPGLGRPALDGAYVKSAGPGAPGTVYIVAGSAASLAGGPLNHPAMAVSRNELGTVVLDIHGRHLDFAFVRDDASMGDSFAIVKPWLSADADADGMADEFELAYGLNPNSAADAATDADGDGASNRSELLAGTDPRDSASAFTSTVAVQDAQPVVHFRSVAGIRYTVERRDMLTSGAWAAFASNLAGTGSELSAPDPAAAGIPSRCYRVHAQP